MEQKIHEEGYVACVPSFFAAFHVLFSEHKVNIIEYFFHTSLLLSGCLQRP